MIIRPKAIGALVAPLVDLNGVDPRQLDPACPVVCADEASKLPIGDIRPPLTVRPGAPAKEGLRILRA